MLILEILNLEIETHIGITKEERALLQILEINLKIYLDVKSIENANDDIVNVLCYDKIIQSVHKFAYENTFNLVETFILKLFDHLKLYEITSNKFDLCVTKKPEIMGLKGGVKLFIKDRE